MNTNHLTEIEIQQYCFEKESCESRIVNHIELCRICKERAASYELISSEIKNIQSPVFDFNLAALVLSRVPQQKSKFSFNIFLVCFAACVPVASLGVPLFFLKEYITNVFTGILPSLYYMIAISALIVVVFQVIEMYMHFHNKMSRLELY